jgi:hypothetical protein
MDNLNDIINSLSADDINMLKGVASSILGEQSKNNSSQKSSDVSNSADVTNTTALVNNLDNVDFEMIMKAKNIFEKMNNTKNKNVDLIMALKPHLNPQTQNKADQALRILKLFEVLPLLKELF